MSKHRWIQSVTKSIAKRGTKGVCTGAKFGSSSCPPGSKRYNLAVTFRKMAKSRRKAEGGVVGNKISLLMKEGYPQKQAVAIALDMQRKGKLQDGGSVNKELSGKEKQQIEINKAFGKADFLNKADTFYTPLNIINEAKLLPFAFKGLDKSPNSLLGSALRQTNLNIKEKVDDILGTTSPLPTASSIRSNYLADLNRFLNEKEKILDRLNKIERYKNKPSLKTGRALEKEAVPEFKHGGKIPEWLYDARGKAMRRRMRQQMRDGGVINKYPFGGAINKGVTSIATALGAKPENAQLWGSALSTLTGFIPGMQDNLLQGADLIGDIGTTTGQEELQQLGQFTRPVADITGMFTGDTGNILGKVPWKGRHGGDPRYAQFHNLPQEEYDKAVINVEKDELEVSQGKIITDYKAKPRHPKNEAEIDSYGNTLAKPGNIIIPRDKREAYLKGDKITRNTIEAQLKRDQSKREREELGELRGRDQYLKSLSENVRRHISATGKTPVEGSSPSIFPPGYGVGLKDLDLYRHGGNINNLNAEDYSNLFYGMGGCVGCGYADGGSVLPDFLYQARGRAMRKANPGYFKHGGKIRYQDGSMIEKAPAYEDEFGYQNFLNSQLADYYGKSQAAPITPYTPGTTGYNVPQYSPAISTSQTTFDPFYNPGTANFGINKSVQTQGNRFGFSDFAQYAAPLYNIGMGLFGKTPQAEIYQNPYAERVKDIMGRRKISMDPILRDIETSEAGARRQLRGISGGSAAIQLAGMGNIQNISAMNRARARMQEQQANIGFRGEEAQTLDILGQQNVQARERQRQLQYAMEANRAQYLDTGIGQLGTTPQHQSRDALLKKLLQEKGITI